MNHIGSFLGGVGKIGGDLLHGNFGGAASQIGKDIAGIPNWLSGAGGKTGQPIGGLPGANEASLAQGATKMPDVSAGASPTTAPAMATDLGLGAPGGALDQTIDAIRAGGGSALDQALLPRTDAAMTAPLAAGSVDPNILEQTVQSLGGGADLAKDVGKGAAPSGGFNLGSFLTRTAIPGAAMAYQIYQGNQGFPGQGNLDRMAHLNEAQAQVAQNGAMEAMQGHLPGAAESGIQQGLRAAQATIRSRYANMGLSGSTMEADDLANAEQSAVAMRFQIGQEMARTGLAAAGNANTTAAALYELIMNGMVAQGTQLGNALSAFAGAAAH